MGQQKGVFGLVQALRLINRVESKNKGKKKVNIVDELCRT
jgi:hypothetical protein